MGSGRKWSFFVYCAFYELATNLVLYLLLLVSGTGRATFLSKVINVSLCSALYGKKVFRVERLQQCSVMSCLPLALLLWWENWAMDSRLGSWGLLCNLSVLLLIPVMAGVFSTLQKLVVFLQLLDAAVLN